MVTLKGMLMEELYPSVRKNSVKKGFIDGGIYLIKKSIFSDSLFGESFSFNNFMIKNMDTLKIGSKVFDNFFIDIGTPEDFQ